MSIIPHIQFTLSFKDAGVSSTVSHVPVFPENPFQTSAVSTQSESCHREDLATCSLLDVVREGVSASSNPGKRLTTVARPMRTRV